MKRRNAFRASLTVLCTTSSPLQPFAPHIISKNNTKQFYRKLMIFSVVLLSMTALITMMMPIAAAAYAKYNSKIAGNILEQIDREEYGHDHL